jgi:tRNA A-37 threonylcarbamoyl transferase component Bud32
MGSVSVWGDFEVRFDQVLGRGGMGTVYRARQISLDRWVAVKVLDTSRAPDPELAEGFFERFHLEARALARLRDPRIVTILQAGENDGRWWFAMELIEGRTVEARLTEEGAFPEAEARRVGLEVARALDAALKQGITHRDVKPANIFLEKEGGVKLADFGLARSPEFARTRITDANALCCTPAYTAPESAEGRGGDHRSDLYSLGCVLYEMVTERPPFTGDAPVETLLKHASEKPLAPSVLNPQVSAPFERMLLKCLAKKPEDRYPTYGDLIADLERRAPEAKREWFWPAAAAAGVAVLGVILTAIFSTAVPAPPPVAAAPAPVVILKPDPFVPVAPIVNEAEPVVQPPVAKPPPPAPPAPARYVPDAEDLADLERLLEMSRASLADRTAWRFEAALAALAATEFTPWVEVFADAERERLEAAARIEWPFAPGRPAAVERRDGRTLRGTVVSADEKGLVVETSSGLRETVARDAVAPSTFGASAAARSGAGDARGALELLAHEGHAPGVADQAIEEALRGDFAALVALEVPEDIPGLGERLKLLREEQAAAALYLKKDFGPLLAERPTTRAGRRAAAETLEAFRASLPKDDVHELVGEVPFGTWGRDLFDAPKGRIAYERGLRAYVLEAPGVAERAWLLKPLKGARAGYQVRFRFASLGDPRLFVALGPSRVLAVSAREVSIGTQRVALAAPIEAGTLSVVPAPPGLLVYLGERLVLALADLHDEGLKLAAGGGSLVIESIRVKDRNR